MLIFLAETETPTTGGLKTIFKKTNLTYLLLSIGWSLKTCISLHVKALALEKPYFPISSMIVSYLWTSVAAFKRMLVLVIYFAPGVGMFNLLHHIRFEQIPFAVRKHRRRSFNDSLFLQNSTNYLWKDIDRWNYKDPSNPTPPSYIAYTGLSVGEFFGIFWLILALHTYSNIIIKLISSQRFRREASAIEMFSHGLESCYLPMPWKDWDDGVGSTTEHAQRLKMVTKEMLAVFSVNFVYSFIMLLPLFYTGIFNLMNYQKRCTIIRQTVFCR